MIQERKGIKNYNQMLYAYESSCNKISSRYNHEMSKMTEQSIKTLCSMFQSYLSKKQVESDTCQYTKVNSTQESSIKQTNLDGDKVHEQNIFCPTSYKKQNKPKQKQNMKITKQISQLSLDSEGEDQKQEEDEPTKKYTNIEDIKNKNLADMIKQSMKKAEDKFIHQPNVQPLELSDSQYEITDYSSNQSSNEGSYSPYYTDQAENKPLFGGLFTKTNSNQSFSNSSSNLLNFSFSSKQLLKSPKKVAKNKRLFIGVKKIPRWAEDLGEIEKISSKQNVDSCSIFGKCVVQNLDTNLIFQGKQQGYQRTSSAKWNSQIFIT